MTTKQLLLITHEYPPFKGGIANYSLGIAKALKRQGYNVSVVTIKDSTDREEVQIREEPDVIYIPVPKGLKWWRLLRLMAAYRRIIRLHPFHTIHCLDTESWRILNLLNCFGDYPFSLTVHGSDIISTRRSVRARFLGTRRLFKGVKRVVAVSEFTRNLFMEKFRDYKGGEILIAHPAPSGDILGFSRNYLDEKRSIRPFLRILTVARIDARKGHVSTFSTLQQLALENDLRFEWVIVGDSVDKEYLTLFQERIAKASFPIFFCGSLSQEALAEEYQKADLFLLAGEEHPKRVEGFGMVYLEAGLFGLPSVGTLVGGAGEAVIDGVTGLMSKPGDRTALIKNLKILFTNAELRSKMGVAARDHASSFSWDRTAAATFPDQN